MAFAQVPTVTTQAVSDITTTTATGNGNITDLGGTNPTAHGVVWNTTGMPTLADNSTNEGGTSTIGTFTSNMTGLTPGTIYYVRAYATNDSGTTYGGQESFITLPTAPEVTTDAVDNISATTATGHGTLDALNDASVSQYGVCWSTSEDPTTSDPHTELGTYSGSTPYTFPDSNMTSLLPNTTYYVRAYATNSVGTTYGIQVSFTTLPQAPEVTTDAVDNIGVTTATGHGTLDALNDASVSQHGVCWSTSEDPTTSDPHTELGAYSGSTPYTFPDSNMTSLLPYTTYYVRAYATNTAGTSYGTQESFTTLPQVPAVTTDAVDNIGATTATGHGTLDALNDASVSQHGVCWSTSENPTTSDPHTELGIYSGSTPYTFANSDMTSLLPGTTYYVRAYATNSVGTTYGGQVSFTSYLQPTVTTQAATNISPTSATGNGNITVLGVPNPTAHGVCWNTAGDPTTADNVADNGAASATGAYTAAMSGLAPGTLYYVRAFATNAVTTVYGNEVQFTSYKLPTVTTQAASDATEDSATGHGTIEDLGIPSPTQHGFIWSSTETNPTLGDNEGFSREGSYSGNVPYEFESEIEDLEPFKFYYVRAYATNNAGTAYGVAQAFATDPDAMVIGTESVTNIDQTTTTGGGDITNLGVPAATQHGICWNTTGTPTTDDAKTELGAPTETGVFSSEMTGLTPGTTYYVRAYATNPLTTVYGGEVSFTTLIAPEVTTLPVSLIGDTTATGNGSISNKGVPAATAHGICWSRAPGIPTLEENDGFTDEGVVLGTGPFQSNMTDLIPNSTYNVRAYATNAVETVYGETKDFTTDPSASGLTTTDVTNIFTDSATANGILSVLGVPPPTQHGFCWSTFPNPTVVDPADSVVELGPYDGDVPYLFNHVMTGLTTGTLYYVRAYATSLSGTAYGNTVTFTTASDASSPQATLTDLPPGLTSATSYSIGVGGIGVVSYQYRLDGNSWSTETDVANPIEFDLIPEGPHTLGVIGKNAAGFWQPADSPTQASWTIDLTPPVAVLSNYPKGTVSTPDASIMVGGVDVAYYRYRVDDVGGSWSSIRNAGMPINLSNLDEGEHTLEVIGADQTHNWQAEGDASEISWNVDLSVPTAVLNNIPAIITSQTSATIQVASSSQGPTIQSYVYSLDDGDTWSEETGANTPIQISDMAETEAFNLCVNGFGGGTWQGGGDGTAIGGATCVQWRVDLSAPDSIVLVVTSGNPGTTTARLTWNWSSDDSQEILKRYRIWYATESFVKTSLDTATQIFCDLIPGPQGVQEQYTVRDLQPDQEYYFGVDAIDSVGNVSSLSNVASLQTTSSLPVIDSISLGSSTIDNSAARELNITGNNFLESENSNIIRLESNTQVFDFFNKNKTGSSAGLIFADIPKGAPTGTFQVRVINKNIIEAVTPFPNVRAINPVVVQSGVVTPIVVEGSNFEIPPAGVNLLSSQGGVTALTNLNGIDATELTAEVDVAVDFPAGRYHVQVINPDSRANNVSAAWVEIYQPVVINNADSAVITTKMVDLTGLSGGMLPVSTTLTTDDRDEAGGIDKDGLKIKVYLQPGSQFEIYDPDTDEWNDYSGVIRPPRQVPASDSILNAFGVDSVQFSMGADSQLRLKNSQTMFVTIEVTLPNGSSGPDVYYLASDGSRTLAGVGGTWQGLEIDQGGTILAVQTETPEVGKATYTIGLLLTHMSDFAIGSISSPDDDSSGLDDTYSSCFIETARSDAFKPSRCIFLMVLMGTMAVFGFARRFLGRYFPTLIIVVVMLLSTPLFVSNLQAAEGAAAGAPPAGSTEAEPEIGVPTFIEEEQTNLERLKKLEKQQSDYVPAAASGVQETSKPKVDRPWYIHAGVGYAYIGSEVSASLDGETSTHEVESEIHPIVRGSYGFSEHFSVELSISNEYYSGSVDNSLSGDDSDMTGYTIALSGVYYAREYAPRWLGPLRPMVLAGVGYRIIESDLDYPVDGYKPGVGFLIGTGIQKGDLELRLGYGFFLHDADGADSAYSSADDQLDTSGISLEVTYRFNIF